MDARYDVTELLIAWRDGARVSDRLFPLVYDELREIAHRQLGRERSGHTLGTTALVHEAYLKLVDQNRANWQDRGHFYAVAAQAMRRILVDYARRHRAAKRGGDWRQVSLDEDLLVAEERAENILALDDALLRLASVDARLAQVVEYRFFGGLKDADIGHALGVTERTVQRDWVKAKAWLHRELAR